MIVLIRGHSGSGKSTLAKKLNGALPNSTHLEADEFFIYEGEYKFDVSKLSEAHKFCFSKTKKALKNGQVAIVANTFTRNFEIKPYVDLCRELNEMMIIFECNGNYQNVHGLSEELLNRQIQRKEEISNDFSDVILFSIGV